MVGLGWLLWLVGEGCCSQVGLVVVVWVGLVVVVGLGWLLWLGLRGLLWLGLGWLLWLGWVGCCSWG